MLRGNTIGPKSRAARARTRALQVLARMRREGLSLAAASHLERIKPVTVLRHVGSAIIQGRPGGRFHATAGDTFRRDLQIPTAFGPTTVPVYGSKQAQFLSSYLNAVAEYLRTGSEAALMPFKGKMLTARGQKIQLITDPASLSMLAEADALRLDHLYASFAGAA